MKIFILLCFIFSLFAFSAVGINAQNLTLILFRHAEKEPSTPLNNNDPDLTAAGKARAEKLFEVLKKYKPNQIFSTNRVRTRATVLPLAEKSNEKYRLQIQIYDGASLEAFAQKILNIKYGTIAVSGHSDTTPELANILMKQEKYKDFNDDEYDKIIIIKIKGKKISDTVLRY